MSNFGPMAAINTSGWLPEAASAHAQGVDTVFYLLYAAAAIVLVVGVGLAAAFFRMFRRQGDETAGAVGGPNRLLLGLWLLGAVALAWFAFTAGIPGLVDQQVAPYEAYRINVMASQDGFDFIYPNGHVTDTLTVQAGQPVDLALNTADVSHGFSIPALRVHQAIVPGHTTRAWFEATEPGNYPLQSNIVGGDDVEKMLTVLRVLDAAGFGAWIQNVEDIFAGRTLPEVGELLYTRLGCMACHTVNGPKLVGPTFQNLYGYEFTTVDGAAYTVDDEHIRQSMLDPNASVRADYAPVMTPFAGLVDDQEIEAIVEWLKTLSDKGGTAAADTTGQAEEPAPQEDQ